ncbi:TPA: YigZ family protein [bacterium]|nr:YigZ family protein [bacterium]
MQYILDGDASVEIIIKKSRFISYVFPVSSEIEIEQILNNLKKEHKSATHVCYAYVLDENTFKFYDDGEPAATAGLPIYQTLKNNNLIYTLAVVVRYFGGIKLGSGGLIRAYSKATNEALNVASISQYIPMNTYELVCNYEDFDKISYLIEKYDGKVIDKKFEVKVTLIFSINEEKLKELETKYQSQLHLKVTRKDKV